MKKLFTINIKTFERGTNEFLLRKPDPALEKKMDEASATYTAFRGKRKMPLWYTTIQFIFLLCGICLLVFVSKCTTGDFQRAYSSWAWALYVGAIGLFLWLVMFAFGIIYGSKDKAGPEANYLVQQTDDLVNRIKENLSIPENCAEADVLYLPFKLANDGTKKRGSIDFNYLNMPMWIFKEGENLCFADVTGVWAIPLASFKAVLGINKSATVSQWNKYARPDSPQYSEDVKMNGYGLLQIKKYYSVQFISRGEEWEILIPSYDIDVIAELTKLLPSV